MGAPRTIHKVLGYLEDKTGQEFRVKELIADTGLDKKQILSALSQLRQKGYRVDGIISGEIYHYGGRPPVAITKSATNGKRLFEEVGQTKSGVLILQDDSGNIFRAEELQ